MTDKIKAKFAEKALPLAKEMKEYVKEHGDMIIDTVSISQLYGGMRDVLSLITETSLLDAYKGISFRGYSIPELKELLPKAPNCTEPLPEGIFYLMLTGELPTADDVKQVSAEWQKRSAVPQFVFQVLDTLPVDTHPMTQFSTAIMALQNESVFAKKYEEGMSKADYWDATYEDAMNLIAKLPRIAAYIFRRTYHSGNHIAPDPTLDWAGNFAHMLGIDAPEFKSLMRLYLTIHVDHEGGNASAHTTHLVGSTLSDAYLSFAAAMNALAGPLHGLANQEVIRWIFNMLDELGTQRPTQEQIEQYIRSTLAAGKVVPGYGHAVLRSPDPRFIAQMEFCKQYFPDDPIVNVVWDIYAVAPKVLGSIGKIKNPYPNVDAHSGATLVHYGVNQYNFYTVLFGVSRALGVLASLCWDRALGLPLERPKSITFEWMKNWVAQQKSEQVSAN
ncbi:type I citrate synthase [Sphingobacteriales bacterium UPWRP_1]|nr:type I citrate synthase [Sphingobacteriales bacterium TSM_CSS]PSJ73985.1 type I citrate synthase [Sphingobacteriales bacterium UPWRP_1]